MSQLQLTRASRLDYECKPPCRSDQWTAIRLRKLVKAMISIIVCGPEIPVGENLVIGMEQTLRQSPELAN